MTNECTLSDAIELVGAAEQLVDQGFAVLSAGAFSKFRLCGRGGERT
jgi:thiazole synthase ThiGH ThiG subunit